MFGHASRVSLRLDCGRKEVRDMNTYDAVILGSGHNSLILQAYLARAGLETICLESQDRAGLSTCRSMTSLPPRLTTHSLQGIALTEGFR